nr:hypothetical protein [Pandoravirus belohorizontensis]
MPSNGWLGSRRCRLPLFNQWIGLFFFFGGDPICSDAAAGNGRDKNLSRESPRQPGALNGRIQNPIWKIPLPECEQICGPVTRQKQSGWLADKWERPACESARRDAARPPEAAATLTSSCEKGRTQREKFSWTPNNAAQPC